MLCHLNFKQRVDRSETTLPMIEHVESNSCRTSAFVKEKVYSREVAAGVRGRNSRDNINISDTSMLSRVRRPLKR